MLIGSCLWQRWLSRWTLRSTWAVMLLGWSPAPSDSCWSSPRMTWSSSTWTKSALHWSPHCRRRRSEYSCSWPTHLSLGFTLSLSNTNGLKSCNRAQTSLQIGIKSFYDTECTHFAKLFYFLVCVVHLIPEWEMPWQSTQMTGLSFKESKCIQLLYKMPYLTVRISSSV